MRFRDGLPQLDGPLFLTDGGIETTLIFHHGLALPEYIEAAPGLLAVAHEFCQVDSILAERD